MTDFQDRLPQRSGDIPFDKLQEIAAAHLIPSGYPGRNTEKYFVRGYPHLIIRDITGVNYFYTIEDTAQIFNELPGYGINSLPYVPFRHDKSEYVVTYKVDGEALDDVIDREVDDETASRIDTTWANLVTYLQRRKQHNKPYAKDIYTRNQFMLGTIPGDAQPKLWMVDLESADSFIDYPLYLGYEGELFDIANEILYLQHKLARSLPNSQSALYSALGTIDPLLAAEARESFKNGIKIEKYNETKEPILRI